KEYVLVSQNEAMVDTYYRTEDGTWEITTIIGLDKTVLLKSIGCEISMANIYLLVPDLNEEE
ncbi:MAG: Uma2 family endonuclease, partial [Bacteroidetes bacterium]|nr:Uma2 family endonuclease [Bacteroidota bacterium]